MGSGSGENKSLGLEDLWSPVQVALRMKKKRREITSALNHPEQESRESKQERVRPYEREREREGKSQRARRRESTRESVCERDRKREHNTHSPVYQQLVLVQHCHAT